MKRLLYYRFILSGFTPAKVLLKDRLSSLERNTHYFISGSVKKKHQQIKKKELKHFGIA